MQSYSDDIMAADEEARSDLDEGSDDQAENAQEEQKSGEEEYDEDEYGEEENSFVELYFQPKFQYPRENAVKVNNMLEVLTPFMDEKIYDDLRTQQ